MNNASQLTFIGGPTLHFTYAGLSFLTDPTFDDPRAYVNGPITLTKTMGPALSAAELGAVDVVLLSHDQHADNLDDSGRAYLDTVKTVLSTTEAAARITGITALEPWQSLTLRVADYTPGDAREITVTAVPALHGPEGSEPISGKVIGFVLEADGWLTTYVSGDNASLELIAEIAGKFANIELAIVFAGAANVGRFGEIPMTLTATEAIELAQLMPRAKIVPVHVSDWAHFTEPLDAFLRDFAARADESRLVVPPRGVAISA
jgi:L-ascorbate metabolism protein UlaG (beta-lactamase superfamily)